MPLVDKAGRAFLDGESAPRCVSVITAAGGMPEEAPLDDDGGQVINLSAALDACIDEAQAIKAAGG